MDLHAQDGALTPVLRTERLLLRPLTRADASPLAQAINDFEISKWLAVVPFPYGLDDALWFIEHVAAGRDKVFVIDDGALAGIIGLGAEFGYWLARDRWGRGYATEAGRAVLAAHFAQPDAPDVLAGHFTDNAASGRVLAKLGFVPTAPRIISCRARGHDMPSQGVVLTRARWDSLEQSPPIR